MAVSIGVVLIDAFMVIVIAVGLVLLAAMIREQIPRRRSKVSEASAHATRKSGSGLTRFRIDRRRAA